VHIDGIVTTGDYSSTIFTLAATHRPSVVRRFIIDANGAFGRVDVNSDGTVVLAIGVPTAVSLDGICFYVGW
jgi:hypothetical protein